MFQSWSKHFISSQCIIRKNGRLDSHHLKVWNKAEGANRHRRHYLPQWWTLAWACFEHHLLWWCKLWQWGSRTFQAVAQRWSCPETTHNKNTDSEHVRESLEQSKVTDVHSVRAWTCLKAMLSAQVPCLQLMLWRWVLMLIVRLGVCTSLEAAFRINH